MSEFIALRNTLFRTIYYLGVSPLPKKRGRAVRSHLLLQKAKGCPLPSLTRAARTVNATGAATFYRNNLGSEDATEY
jgi:hypothetical protein